MGGEAHKKASLSSQVLAGEVICPNSSKYFHWIGRLLDSNYIQTKLLTNTIISL